MSIIWFTQRTDPSLFQQENSCLKSECFIAGFTASLATGIEPLGKVNVIYPEGFVVLMTVISLAELLQRLSNHVKRLFDSPGLDRG